MDDCSHKILVLLPPDTNKLRCRHCHLTISKEELGQGHCPECYEVRSVRHEEFDEVEADPDAKVRYRCETCPLLVECDPT